MLHILCDVIYRFLSNVLDLLPNVSFSFIQASQLDVSDIFFQAPLSRHRNSGVGSKDRRRLHAAGRSTNRSAPMETSGHVSPWAIHGVFIRGFPVKWMIWVYPYFRKPPICFSDVYIEM